MNRTKKIPVLPGYCALCRAWEIDHYGDVVNNGGPRHRTACEKAGCKHPPFYRLPPDGQGPGASASCTRRKNHRFIGLEVTTGVYLRPDEQALLRAGRSRQAALGTGRTYQLRGPS